MRPWVSLFVPSRSVRRTLGGEDLGKLRQTYHRFGELHDGQIHDRQLFESPKVSFVYHGSRALLSKPPMQKLTGSSSPAKAGGHRQAYFGNGFVRTAVYDGPSLRANQSVKGPAIIEEPFTTIVVPPRWNVKLDKFGNYVASK